MLRTLPSFNISFPIHNYRTQMREWVGIVRRFKSFVYLFYGNLKRLIFKGGDGSFASPCPLDPLLD